MGGFIGVTVRKETGEEFRMGRWTNPLPGFINNLKLANKDEDHVNDYINEWGEMRMDYLNNKGTEDFEHRMSPVYGDFNQLYPDGYGLVVVDLKEDKIHSMQGYTSFGLMRGTGISLDNSGNVIGGTAVDRIREFYENGRIRGVTTPNEYFQGGNLYELNDYNNFKDFLENDVEKKVEMGYNDNSKRFKDIRSIYVLDLSPLEVIQYEDYNPTDAAKFFENLEEDGFEFSSEEVEEWNNFISDHNQSKEEVKVG